MIASLAMLALSGCGGDQEAPEPSGEALVNSSAPVVTFTPESGEITVDGETQAPLAITYRIIGAPVVNQPVAIDIKVVSSLGDFPVSVSYRSNDETAIEFTENQAESVVLTPDENGEYTPRQLTVIPKREGRLYLNVQAGIETRDGSLSTATAIPIEVGAAN